MSMEKAPGNNKNEERNRRLVQMGQKADADLNEIYAKKYEESSRLGRERMMELERKLGGAKSESEKQDILAEIAKERDHIQEMNSEAEHRRRYNKEAGS